MPKPSIVDIKHLKIIRDNVEKFMRRSAKCCTAKAGKSLCLLDIAPQDHAGARPFFPERVLVETLDIVPAARATYTADICANNSHLIRANHYDIVVCTEVLEHTLRPFDAVREMRRLLKRHGLLLLSVPFNLRIHGPLPDCWRFTEHGLRAMLSEGFSILELRALGTPGRPLMPLHYTIIAEKK